MQETQFMKVRSKTPVPWRCMTLRLAEVIHKMQHDEPRPETLKGKRETEIETEMKREKYRERKSEGVRRRKERLKENRKSAEKNEGGRERYRKRRGEGWEGRGENR